MSLFAGMVLLSNSARSNNLLPDSYSFKNPFNKLTYGVSQGDSYSYEVSLYLNGEVYNQGYLNSCLTFFLVLYIPF